MRTHFISRLALAILGGFLVVVSQVWAGATVEWLFFAGGVAMTLIAAADLFAAGLAQRVLDGVIAVLGIWTIVEALTFTGSALTWISFGGAAALVALAVIGLVLHEMSTERVVHELSVTGEREVATAAAGERELTTA